MAIDIETLFTNINGTAPNPKSLAKIKEAGLQLQLEDHDAFWLILIAFEGQQSEVAKAMSATSNLADTIKTAAAGASTTAAAIRKILNEGAPSLAKAVQDATLGVSGELKGAIGDAVEHGAKLIQNKTEIAAFTFQNVITADLETATHQFADKINSAANEAVNELNRAKACLANEAAFAGSRTVAKWVYAVDAAVSKQIAQKVSRDEAVQVQRTILAKLAAAMIFAGGFIGVWSIANSAGYKTGYAEGEKSNFDAKERAAWGNSREGQIAYFFARTGNLEMLAACDKPGWTVEQKDTKRVCYPKESAFGLYGWFIP